MRLTAAAKRSISPGVLSRVGRTVQQDKRQHAHFLPRGSDQAHSNDPRQLLGGVLQQFVSVFGDERVYLAVTSENAGAGSAGGATMRCDFSPAWNGGSNSMRTLRACGSRFPWESKYW